MSGEPIFRAPFNYVFDRNRLRRIHHRALSFLLKSAMTPFLEHIEQTERELEAEAQSCAPGQPMAAGEA